MIENRWMDGWMEKVIIMVIHSFHLIIKPSNTSREALQNTTETHGLLPRETGFHSLEKRKTYIIDLFTDG